MESSGRRNRVRLGDSDRISNLSDDLLHIILLNLRSTKAAARTSVLSRRWRHVWAALPDLLLEDMNAVDSVDAALAACSAPTINRLAITMALLFPNDLTTVRVNPWLLFASERLASEMTLRLPRTIDAEGEISLPFFETVTGITFIIRSTLRLATSNDGAFASLTVARITGARMASSDLECFGSSLCPCLRTLELRGVSLVTGSQVSIRSESLERLVFRVRGTNEFELVTPRLQYLRAPARASLMRQASIVAPKLADLSWHVDYRRERHQFVEVGNYLRRLVIAGKGRSMIPLLRRFHKVDELVLKSAKRQPGHGSARCIVVRTPILAECTTLEVDLHGTFIVGETDDDEPHTFAPSVLHLLRKLQGLRKLVVHLPLMTMGIERVACTIDCPVEGCKVDDIVLDFLEEVVLLDFNGADDHLEFLSLLLACNAKNLDTVSINMFSDNPSTTMETCQQRIIRMSSSKKDVRFNVWSQSHGAWVPYMHK